MDSDGIREHDQEQDVQDVLRLIDIATPEHPKEQGGGKKEDQGGQGAAGEGQPQ